MYPVKVEHLDKLIRQAEKAGKDTRELKRIRARNLVGTKKLKSVRCRRVTHVVHKDGKKQLVTIISTGPATADDFADH